MADFAPNFTARYRLHYTVLGHAHSQLWRIERGTGPGGLSIMIAKVGEFLTTLIPSLFSDFLATSAEYAPEDVDIFAPAGLPTLVTGGAVIPPQPISQSTLSVSFVGRSSAGQKARLFMWGLQMSPEAASATTNDNFRITSSESAVVAAAVAELNQGFPQLIASDNNPVIFYSYVNTKYNDHWVARVRS